MDLETFERLLHDEGQLLGEFAELAERLDDLALGTRLRRRYPAELVAAALTQHRLRQKARAKLGHDASRLFFTPDALQQATRAVVAEHRAAGLRQRGAHAVVDLGCGIGSDLIACAQAGLRVRGVEIDPVRAAIAAANLRALGLDGEVLSADATTTPIADDEVVFVDPARRDGRGRVTSLDGLVPPWPWVRDRLAGRAVAKVMPGIAHDAIPAGVQAEWVSDRGDLVEACLWGAGLDAEAPAWSATVLPSGGSIVARGAVARTGRPGRYLVEPDDAVIRAGLVAEFAEEIDGRLLDARIAYVTTDAAPAGHLGRWYEILEELPYREKALRAALRERDLGTLTIKKRGVEVVPERLVARLKARGSIPATLVLTRAEGAGRAFWVRPCPRAAGDRDDPT